MIERKVRGAGAALLLISACLGLATCSSTSNVTSLAPTAIAVKRYLGTGLTAGALDTGFGGTGAVFTKIDPSEFEYALAVALQSDGKILAAGHSVLAGQGVIALVRYNTDGSLDLTFGAGQSGFVRTPVPSVNAVGTAIAVQPGAQPADDKILVAGSTFDPSTGMTGIAVVRYDANGLPDTTGFGTGGIVSAEIGPGTDTDVVSLALQGTNIIVAGATSDGNFVLKRYDSTGTLDPTFGDVGTPGTATTGVGASAQTPAIALQMDGSIVVAGGSRSATNSPNNAVLVRYSVDGILDTGFGGGANGGIVLTDIASSDNFSNAIAVQPADDKIVAAGHAKVDFNADTSDFALIRYNADGTPDTGFGASGAVVTDVGAFDNAFSVALQPGALPADDKIVVSGNASVSGVTRVAIVRYNSNNGSLDAGFNSGGIVTTVATGPSGVASGNAVVVVQPDGGIVVAGYD